MGSRWRVPPQSGRRVAGPRRAAVALSCAVAGTALLVAGCGAEQHVNDPRPQPPTRISVAISKGAISVRPPKVAFGPEPTQQLPQNAHTTQPRIDSKAPLDVAIVAANLTEVDSHLELRGNGVDLSSQLLVRGGNVTLQGSLPTGAYRISAADIPGAGSATLKVGPYRTTSRNDLLLP